MSRTVYGMRLSGFDIQLLQLGRNRFEVHYGLQVDRDLDYAQAAAKLGEAIMHALACEGRLDNRMPGEKS